MISGIIKVSASVISLGLWPRLITLASTLIILDITKASSNYCFIIPGVHNPPDYTLFYGKYTKNYCVKCK